jgi:hypothetical protein
MSSARRSAWTEPSASPRVKRGARDRLARSQALEVQILDDAGVGVGAHVDHHLAVALEGVDVVEGEAGLG